MNKIAEEKLIDKQKERRDFKLKRKASISSSELQHNFSDTTN